MNNFKKKNVYIYIYIYLFILLKYDIFKFMTILKLFYEKIIFIFKWNLFLKNIIKKYTINLKMLKIYTILINIFEIIFFEKRAFEFWTLLSDAHKLMWTHRKAGWFQILTENY